MHSNTRVFLHVTIYMAALERYKDEHGYQKTLFGTGKQDIYHLLNSSSSEYCRQVEINYNPPQ